MTIMPITKKDLSNVNYIRIERSQSIVRQDNSTFIIPGGLYSQKQIDFLSTGNCRIDGYVDFKGGKVNVIGNVYISDSEYDKYSLTEIPVKFGIISANFTIYDCGLETLKNCPDKCFNFTCRNMESLESLEGAPKTVENEFDITHADNLETLKGAPEIIKGDFVADFCGALKKLEISNTIIGGEFSLYDNNLTTVKDGPLAKSYNLEQSFDINKKEIELNTSKLLGEWIKSKESIEDFMYRVRGKLAGKKYGF